MKSRRPPSLRRQNPAFRYPDHSDFCRDVPGSLRQSFAFWDFLVLSPAEFLLALTFRGVRHIFHEILRRQRMKELRPTPSLRDTPKPADIDEIWTIKPRTLLDRLRLGSRLLDLEPSVDNSFVFSENRQSGHREIIARHSGIKGWLQDHCPTVAYTTAMAWKKLASRLKTLCGAPANVPLEWLLPDAPEIASLTQDPAVAAAIEAGRKRLSGFLEEGKSIVGLQKLAEHKMNIIRFPSKNAGNSLILSFGGKKSGGRRKSWAEREEKGRGNGLTRGGKGKIRRSGSEREALGRARKTEMRTRQRAGSMPGQLATLAEALRRSEIDPRNLHALRQLMSLLRP